MTIQPVALPNQRILSIDILRALTMFFMIFVNDLWTLSGVPKWLEHTAAQEDGMGFSDIIFPLFLFIVGLSIPLAIQLRKKKKDSTWVISKHIFERSFGLLLMGVFMVNVESINVESLRIPKFVWQFLMATGILLVWLNYKSLSKLKKRDAFILKCLGIIILVFLAVIYEGGTSENPEWMKFHWWGILGLIGWAYLFNAFYFLFFGHKLIFVIIAFLVLNFMHLQEFHYFENLPSIKLIISASNHILVLSGVLCTMLFLHFKKKNNIRHVLALLTVMAFVFICYGFIFRPNWGISKILATPSWTTICMGIGYILFVLFYILIDIFKISKWAKPIKAAGTSTLTCYLMPYFMYPILESLGWKLPIFFTHGGIGITKSLLFSFLIIAFVGFLEKRRISLKI